MSCIPAAGLGRALSEVAYEAGPPSRSDFDPQIGIYGSLDHETDAGAKGQQQSDDCKVRLHVVLPGDRRPQVIVEVIVEEIVEKCATQTDSAIDGMIVRLARKL